MPQSMCVLSTAVATTDLTYKTGRRIRVAAKQHQQVFSLSELLAMYTSMLVKPNLCGCQTWT